MQIMESRAPESVEPTKRVGCDSASVVEAPLRAQFCKADGIHNDHLDLLSQADYLSFMISGLDHS